MSVVIISLFSYCILLNSLVLVGFNSSRLSDGVLRTVFLASASIFISAGFMRLFFYHEYDDFTQYYYHFTNINEFSDFLSFLYSDPIFFLLLYLLKCGGINSPEILYASLSLVACSPLFLFLRRVNNVAGVLFVFLTLLSPFFVIYCGQFVRQSLALSVLLFVASLQNRNARLFGIAFAGLIHLSALLALPVAFIEEFRVMKAMKIFIVFVLIGMVLPIDNSFVTLVSTDNFLFGKVEYWLNDELESASLVFKWVPLFVATVLVSKLYALMNNKNSNVLHERVMGVEARVVWLLLYFTAIGFLGRYLNAFSMRFGLWAIIFGSIPLFLFRCAYTKIMFAFLTVILYLATVANLYINKVPTDFEYIYRYVFFPASVL